ncbi:MAG TPA: FGGY family carbohydrate kinase [Chitinophagaceae bacterium]|nr:FGGY family carbohydrate kinase [Chitinophagaceae bacterium]
MHGTPVIAIFDIGKSNKKLICFDGQYRIVLEQSATLQQVRDEDGYPCEDLQGLRRFILDGVSELMGNPELDIIGINFSAYGASLVYLDQEGNPLTPLYDYLKPYPETLLNSFLENYGGKDDITVQTCSPLMGSLNSGLQLYRIRHQQPEVFGQIYQALHLPQYLSWLLTGKPISGFTSLGCHTMLWDFARQDYHDWVRREGLHEKLAPIYPESDVQPVMIGKKRVWTGMGLHDSSAALIPYRLTFQDPFVLLSTGTWSVSMNPFNTESLTSGDLSRDCLNYLNAEGKAVKASRFLSGPIYDLGTKLIAAHFQLNPGIFAQMPFDRNLLKPVLRNMDLSGTGYQFRPEIYSTAAQAYHGLMQDLVEFQQNSTRMVFGHLGIRNLFVDGGFCRNTIFMHLMKEAFPDLVVQAANAGQASAMGAALIMHEIWNAGPISRDFNPTCNLICTTNC